ncbi:MAG: MOSC N-terminal beta barrel domain-containing protein, partial [Bacteroidia bacterium]
MNPVVSRLTVFPFKSLDGIDCSCVQTGSGSFLQGDRLYALFDARGKYINGKANPLVHTLRLREEEGRFHLTSAALHRSIDFSADSGLRQAADFLSDHFGEEVTIRKNESGKFLDVPVESAITLVSGASLRKAG